MCGAYSVCGSHEGFEMNKAENALSHTKLNRTKRQPHNTLLCAGV